MLTGLGEINLVEINKNNYVANCAALETRGRARPEIGQWELPLYVNQIGCPEKKGKYNHYELPV